MVLNFLNIFDRFIFPPEYMTMPAVGFDLSDLSVKYFSLKRVSGTVVPDFWGKDILPENIIKSGEIIDRERLIFILKNIREKIKIKNVIVSLPEEKSFWVRIKIPYIEKEKIREAIELQIEEYVPLPPEEIIFDFEIVEEIAGSGGHMDINLVAFPKKIIDSYNEVFIEAGFLPVVFEIETQALKRALLKKDDYSAQMIIDFGKTRTTFALINKGKISFNSTIEISGANIDLSIAKNFSIGLREAEEIKIRTGLVRQTGKEKVFESILPVVASITDEINKHIIYWDSHFDEHGKRNEKISKIILCGGEANLVGLSEYILGKLKIPVELANPWLNILSFEKYIPEMGFRESMSYTISLGLALRSIEHNL